MHKFTISLFFSRDIHHQQSHSIKGTQSNKYYISKIYCTNKIFKIKKKDKNFQMFEETKKEGHFHT